VDGEGLFGEDGERAGDGQMVLYFCNALGMVMLNNCFGPRFSGLPL